MKSTSEEMSRIWGDYAVEMHDEQIEVLVDKVNRLEARVKELEMFAQIKGFELSTQRTRLEELERVVYGQDRVKEVLIETNS